MVTLINGLPFDAEAFGQVRPLSAAAETAVADEHGQCMARYGFYPAPRERNGKRATVPFETAQALADLVNHRVDPDDHRRIVEKAKNAEAAAERLAGMLIQALRLDRASIGEASQTETFADSGVKYAKGVRIKTTTGRTIEFYGSRREFVAPTSIDGISPLTMQSIAMGLAEHLHGIFRDACLHLLPTARQAWRGKHRLAEQTVVTAQG